MSTEPSRSRPTKRRSQAEIRELEQAIVRVAAENRPATVRQIFYRLVAERVIDKTEAQYKSTVVRLLTRLRETGQVPWHWITDNTRWMRKPRTYAGIEELLDDAQATYRRDLWRSQPEYVEIWLEKEALAGVVTDVTEEWDVPLMVTRGYPSLSFLAGAARQLRYVGKPARLYYFGDRDPSGVDIPRRTEARLRSLAPSAEIHFSVEAVQPSQIERFGLVTRPTKKTDSRSKAFEGESVELDAIPPADLRRLVEDCIARHVDEQALQRSRDVERAERASLADFTSSFTGKWGGEA